MFIKTSGFKKLIKEAYSGSGLRLANDGNGICIYGSYWMIWVAAGRIPKKELGAIIELTGELPKEGEAFRATKEGNQYELEECAAYEEMETAKAYDCEDEIKTTNIVLLQDFGYPSRVLQRPEYGTILLVGERFIEMIDNTVVDYNGGETQAEGPLVGGLAGVIWKNNTMVFRVWPRTSEKEEKLIKYLEQTDLSEAAPWN